MNNHRHKPLVCRSGWSRFQVGGGGLGSAGSANMKKRKRGERGPCHYVRLCPLWIDAEDYDLAHKHRWFFEQGYWRYRPRKNGKCGILLLHREIMQRKLGRKLKRTELVDHIDGETAHCFRSNLRVTSHSGNALNRRAMSNSRSRIRGICKRNAKTKYGSYHYYTVYLMVGGKQVAHKHNYPQTPAGLAEAIEYRNALYREHGVVIREGAAALPNLVPIGERNLGSDSHRPKTFHEVGFDPNTGKLRWKDSSPTPRKD